MEELKLKKALMILSLVTVIAISIVSGTMALYTTTLDSIAEGSVVAKEFIFIEDGTDTFEQNAKIAPGEDKSWQFSIKNFNDNAVSETAMDLDITIDVTAAEGKSAIAPLLVSVLDEDGYEVATQTNVGTISFDDEFALSSDGQTHTYTVKIEWPSDNDTDITYAGADFGSAISVSVTGTQK